MSHIVPFFIEDFQFPFTSFTSYSRIY